MNATYMPAIPAKKHAPEVRVFAFREDGDTDVWLKLQSPGMVASRCLELTEAQALQSALSVAIRQQLFGEVA